MTRRSAAFLVALLAWGVLLLLVPASPALAHTELMATSPGNGERVGAPPERIILRFSEPVDLGLGEIQLLGPDGKRRTTGEPVYAPGLDATDTDTGETDRGETDRGETDRGKTGQRDSAGGDFQGRDFGGDFGGGDSGERAGENDPTVRSDTVAVPVKGSLPAGIYTVTWQVVSADTHPVRGAFVFTVEPAAGTQGTEGTSPDPAPDPGTGQDGERAGSANLIGGDLTNGQGGDGPGRASAAAVGLLYGASRGTAFAGLALLVGGVFFVAACWPRGAGHRRVRRLVWAGWGALVVSSLAGLLLYGPWVVGRGFGPLADLGTLRETLGSRLGVALTVRLALLVLAAVGLVVSSRRAEALPSRYRRDAPAAGSAPAGGGARGRGGTQRLAAGAVLAGSAVLAMTWGAVSHSATGAQAPLAMAADAVHLVAMSVWLGGLVILGTALLTSYDDDSLRTAVPRFSTTALVCVCLLAVSGTYQSWRQLGGWGALPGTPYGRLLLLKLFLVLAILALAAGARSWVKQHYAPGTVRRAPARPAEQAATTQAAPTKAAVTQAAAAKRAARPADQVKGTRSGGRSRRRRPTGPTLGQVAALRRSVLGESAIAAVVLVLTTVLVNVEPAHIAYAREQRDLQARAEATQGPAGGEPDAPVLTTLGFDTGDGPAGRGSVEVLVQPVEVGDSTMHLTVTDMQGRPMNPEEMAASLTRTDNLLGPLPVRIGKVGPGHWIAAATFPMEGQWQLAVTVRTSETSQSTTTTVLDVG